MAQPEGALTHNSQAEPPITPEIFQHLVTLAALELDGDEADYLRRELNHQLQAIRDLESIELPIDLPITSHGVPYTEGTKPGLRADQSSPSDKADAILEQAPEVKDRYLVVPDIPHTELE